jgi:hypothetical protein
MRNSSIYALARVPQEPLSAEQIAAMVLKPRDLRAAEATLGELDARRLATEGALRSALAEMNDVERNNPGGRQAREIDQLDRKRAELVQQIAAATVVRDQLRQPYIAGVSEALAPIQAAALQGALDALDRVADELRVLHEVGREVEKAGGKITFRFPAIYRASILSLRGRLSR